MNPTEPYSERDDIIVISDEAHRTQAGKLARNMRLALPNAAFIGFTGTPLFKHDQLTRRIFGGYVSRYDFKRSEEDGATVKLVYENRGEKLGIARLDLNDRIAEKVEQADLDPDQMALLEKLLGKDYEVITADDRLDKMADDFVEHCSTRWESGKTMLVCIDKITCGRMYQRIIPRWQAGSPKFAQVPIAEAQIGGREGRRKVREKLANEREAPRPGAWMETTIIEIIISEGQNEVRDFQKWGFDIIPHRERMKHGFETPDGKTCRRRRRLQGPRSSVPRGHCLRHVADRLRRGMPFDTVHRQADEGPHADAGHRPRQPGLSRQGVRRHRGLQRDAQEPPPGAGAIRAGR